MEQVSTGPAARGLLEGVGLDPEGSALHVEGDPDRVLPGPFRVGAAATATVAAATAGVAAFARVRRGGSAAAVSVDAAHAAAVFRSELHVEAPELGPLVRRDAITGNYPTTDGWVRLHTTSPVHRAAALEALGVESDPGVVWKATQSWESIALEQAVIDAGGAAGALRTAEQWLAHPQHAAIAERPLVGVTRSTDAPARQAPVGPGGPLGGVRVLDLTRVIAGPICGRFLAAHGAEVVRIDADHLYDTLALEIDTSVGKRRASLDLRSASDREAFESLLDGADVLVQGYRPGALAGLGYGPEELSGRWPGLVVANLSAYGPTGPWGGRRGFDSVVQLVCGIGHECGVDPETGPGALPAQALDHASGYLLALGILAALTERTHQGGGWDVQVALARTAQWLDGLGRHEGVPPAATDELGELRITLDTDAWGPVHCVRPCGRLDGAPPATPSPPVPRGTHPPRWLAEG